MRELSAATQDALARRLEAAGTPPARVALARRCVAALLERAVRPGQDGGVFVVTGDIPAMWLRDAAAQVRPLLLLAPEVPELAELVAGVLRTQVLQLLVDPRANAFNDGPSGRAAFRREARRQAPWVFERKWALDSPCAPIGLAWTLWRATGSLDHVDGAFAEAASAFVGLLRAEQEHDPAAYRLWRPLRPPRDSPARWGRGRPIGRCGLCWSAFRPSDDACRFGFHVPANALAAVTLERLAELLSAAHGGGAGPARLATAAAALAAELRAAIAEHGVVPGPGGAPVYAYEVDGLGRALLADDANPPSLVSLPYLGYCAVHDPLYRATRALALGPGNRWWAAGRALHGVGSAHTGLRWRRVWPLAVAIEGLTAVDGEEREGALACIEATASPDGTLHESVHADDPRRVTRAWFSWAEMAYVELALAGAGLRLPGTGDPAA